MSGVPKGSGFRGGATAAADLGEIHAVTVTDDSEALVISGRLIHSVKRYRNKRISAIQEALSRCKRGSRNWRKLMRARHRVQAKTEAQLRNLHHNVTARVVQLCGERGVTASPSVTPKASSATFETARHSKRLAKETSLPQTRPRALPVGVRTNLLLPLLQTQGSQRGN